MDILASILIMFCLLMMAVCLFSLGKVSAQREMLDEINKWLYSDEPYSQGQFNFAMRLVNCVRLPFMRRDSEDK